MMSSAKLCCGRGGYGKVVRLKLSAAVPTLGDGFPRFQILQVLRRIAGKGLLQVTRVIHPNAERIFV